MQRGLRPKQWRYRVRRFPLLAPITAREIHARLLVGRHAEVLLPLLWHDSAASRFHEATRDIPCNVSETIVVGDLAQPICMSSPAFFEQFKTITGTSPLQYQKDLRLLRARDALRTTKAKVSEIALQVGYESSAQFSQEFSRKFGRSPRLDRKILVSSNSNMLQIRPKADLHCDR
ncbi:MAG: AraC family transcriptional regulator [Roseibium sp.]